MSWTVILLLAAGAYGIRVLGVTTLGRIVEQRLGAVVSLLPVTLFAALVVVMTLDEGGELVLDGRVVGVAAGAVAAWRKAPMMVVVLVAMAATAGLRLVV